MAVRVGTLTEWTLPATRTRSRHCTAPIGMVPATFGTGRVNSGDTLALAFAWRRRVPEPSSPFGGVVRSIRERPRTRPAHDNGPSPLDSW